MPLELKTNVNVIAPGAKTPFQAVGGTAPYTYSVVVGGAGGSITTGGVYTAPNTFNVNPKLNIDTVRVVDAVAASATLPISILTPIFLLMNIIKTEMGLASDQVYLYEQKFNIPTDSRLYIAIGVLWSKPFANNSRAVAGAGMDQVQSINVYDLLSINILSRSTEALNRKEEVLMALNSVFAKQQQSLNSFKIGQLPTNFVNISNIEGAAIPYCFNASLAIQYFKKKTSAVPYYSEFSSVGVTTEP